MSDPQDPNKPPLAWGTGRPAPMISLGPRPAAAPRRPAARPIPNPTGSILSGSAIPRNLPKPPPEPEPLPQPEPAPAAEIAPAAPAFAEPVTTAPPPRRRGPLLISLGVAAVLAAIGVGVLLRPRPSQPPASPAPTLQITAAPPAGPVPLTPQPAAPAQVAVAPAEPALPQDASGRVRASIVIPTLNVPPPEPVVTAQPVTAPEPAPPPAAPPPVVAAAEPAPPAVEAAPQPTSALAKAQRLVTPPRTVRRALSRLKPSF